MTTQAVTQPEQAFPRFATIAETARLLTAYTGVAHNERSIKRRIYEERTLKAMKIGGRVVIPRSELELYVSELDQAAAELTAK